MSENQVNMQTPASVLAPKQQYLNLIMNSLYEISKICSTNAPLDENRHRVGMLVRMMIAFIPNEDTREELFKYRETEINDFKKKNNDVSALINFTYTVDCKLVGKVMTILDQMLAITDRQVVMLSGGNYNGLENKYFPKGITVNAISGGIQEEEGDE